MTEYLHRDPTLRDELLTIEEVAELLRMPVASLRYWRVLGTGPRGFIIGRRLRYWRQTSWTGSTSSASPQVAAWPDPSTGTTIVDPVGRRRVLRRTDEQAAQDDAPAATLPTRSRRGPLAQADQGRATATPSRCRRPSRAQVTRWRARYVDDAGREHTRAFDRKVDAQKWIDKQLAALLRGDHVTPKDAKLTVGEWCDKWLAGYGTRRKSTVRQAEVHIKIIKAHFGSVPLSAVKPSDVRAWTAMLKDEGRADSYVYALYSRLSQLFTDAVHDGLVARNPCSRRTSPGMGKQRPVRRDDRAGVGALRRGARGRASGDPARCPCRVAAGRGGGVAGRGRRLRHRSGFARRSSGSNEPLKSDTSRHADPDPQGDGAPPCRSDPARRRATSWPATSGATPPDRGRSSAPSGRAVGRSGLPDDFRFHDLRHYFASLLIASGLDVKVVQARLRHASAKTTLDTYGHLWPDRDDTSRAAVAAVYNKRN